MSTETIGPLDPEEIKLVRFKFSAEAAQLAQLQAAAVAVSVLKGADDTPAAILVGDPIINDKDVLQRVSGAGRTERAIYHLRCRAVDSDGNAHVESANLEIKRV